MGTVQTLLLLPCTPYRILGKNVVLTNEIYHIVQIITL